MLTWYRRRRIFGVLLICAGPALVGVALSNAASTPLTNAISTTRTVHVTRHHIRYVTIHVRGKVVGHHDHILIVYVPRTVFRNHATHKRIVVPAHRVKIHEASPTFGQTSAVVGISPLPVTVTVPVYVTVPGPTTTVQGPTSTVTLPQDTTTVTVPTTITLPLSDG